MSKIVVLRYRFALQATRVGSYLQAARQNRGFARSEWPGIGPRSEMNWKRLADPVNQAESWQAKLEYSIIWWIPMADIASDSQYRMWL